MSSEENPLSHPQSYVRKCLAEAELISADGGYTWMASFLNRDARVLEIGCGSGHSTLEVSKHASRVVCIEADRRMAEHAAEFLNANNVTTELVSNLDSDFSLEQRASQVLIVVADIFDQALEKQVRSLRFDSVCCWLLGAPMDSIARHLKKPPSQVTRAEVAKYNLNAHRRVYELSSLALVPGGSVQTIERKAILRWEDEEFARMVTASQHSALAGKDFLTSSESVVLKGTTESPVVSGSDSAHKPEVEFSSIAIYSCVNAKFSELVSP